jgi:predicted DNA-binding transcriptional regulator AlpA
VSDDDLEALGLDADDLVSLTAAARHIDMPRRWLAAAAQRPGFPESVDGGLRWDLLDIEMWFEAEHGPVGLMGVSGLARAIGVERTTMANWVRREGFPPRQISHRGSTAWDKEAVREWVVKHQHHLPAYWKSRSRRAVGVREIAERYDVAHTTVYDWADHPTFPAPVCKWRACGCPSQGPRRDPHLWFLVDVSNWYTEASTRDDMGIKRAGRRGGSPRPRPAPKTPVPDTLPGGFT